MKNEIKLKYKKMRDEFIGAYIFIFIVGRIISVSVELPWIIIILINLVQITIGLIGSYNWMKYKNRNSWLTIIGILGPLGWLILMLLKDKAIDTEA